MIVAHLTFSLVRLELAPEVSLKIAAGWKFVIERQRFLLRNPRENIPVMEAAIAKIDKDGIAAAAELLLAASAAVNHQFSDSWLEMLKTLSKATA
jgi:hypothetical protein